VFAAVAYKVWRVVSVAASVGRGKEAAEIGCVTPEPSTGTLPETRAGSLPSMDDREALPVAWFAAVAPPVGRAEDTTVTLPVSTAVTFPFSDERVASVDAPVGRAEDVTPTFQVPA
jgi:hypothetical protein